ncbi:MAG: oxidative damage protection protein [Candidatus Dasytiphilus stammeri]
MNKIIYCQYLKCQSEAQDYKIYPGKLGDIIYNNISKKAWAIWLLQQTKIINEKKLNMNNIQDQNLIENEMISFLFKSK